MKSFEFEIGSIVTIGVSGERGDVIGRAEYVYAGNSYLIRYKSADGRAVEIWWDEGALTITE